MNSKSAILAAAAMAAGTTFTINTATAADLGGHYRPEPPIVETVAPQPYWNWSGLYFGGNVGYGFSGIDEGALVGPTAVGKVGSLDTDGVFGGAQLGYNWQRERLVFGIETDFQYTDMSDRGVGIYSNDPNFVGASKADLDWFGTVRGRLGFVSGRALFYITGGLAYADVDLRQSATDGVDAVALSSDKVKLGYTVGGGIEYALAPNWSTKLEYQYVDLGDETLRGTSLNGNTYGSKYDLDFHTVRVGLNYKF